MHFDYTTLGHVTVDLMADGTRRPGGAAFYSALQAARLGRRVQILTRGRAEELGELLLPYRDELEIEVEAAEHTTTMMTRGAGHTRAQRVLAWAGPLSDDADLDSAIVHLAPVARETPAHWRRRARFVGLTPQGLVRRWPQGGGEITLAAPGEGEAGAAEAGGERGACDALVVSAHERAACAALIERARRGGAVVAVTDGANPTTLLLADGRSLQVAVAPVAQPRDDLGAGDVFAAAFFVSLADGAPPREAAAFASAAAAVRVGGEGPGAIGDRAQIEKRMRATRP